MKAKTVEWFKVTKSGSGGFCFVPAFPNGESPSSAAGHSAAAAGPKLSRSPTPAGASEAPAAHHEEDTLIGRGRDASRARRGASGRPSRQSWSTAASSRTPMPVVLQFTIEVHRELVV